jgi:HK97 family phage portal protein
MRLFERRAKAPVPVVFSPVWKGWDLSEENPAALRCESLIAETIASLPLTLYEKTASGRKKAAAFSEYAVAKYRPNPYEVPSVFYAELVRHILRKGNAFLQKQRHGAKLEALYRLDPDRMKIELDGAKRTYVYNGTPMSRFDIVHIPGLYGYNGVQSQGVIRYAKSTLELSNKLAEYLGYYLENSINTKLKLEVPIPLDKLDDTALAKLKQVQDLIAKSLGKERTGKPLTIFEGMKADPIDLASNKDSELSVNREMQDKLIAMFYGVPYSLISGDNKYDSLERFNIQFLTYCLMPYLKRIAQTFTAALLPINQQERFYFEHSFEMLLQPDTKTRFEIYETAINNGLMSVDQVKERENMDALGGVEGSQHFLAANLMPLRADVIEAYMAGAKTKQEQLDNKAR